MGSPSLDSLLADAAAVAPLRFVVDADDPVFLPPGDMPARIAAWLSARGLPAPSEPAQVVRCVLDSLAMAYRRALLAAQALSGQHADVVHIVGGGSRNALLCQLTADALGLPVVAGPAEATALGNALVQARALGAAPGSLDGMRALLRGSQDLRHFFPRWRRPCLVRQRTAAGPGRRQLMGFTWALPGWRRGPSFRRPGPGAADPLPCVRNGDSSVRESAAGRLV